VPSPRERFQHQQRDATPNSTGYARSGMSLIPKQSTRQIIGLSIMIILLTPPTCYGPNFFTNQHTRFCPITHKFAEGAACFVLDEEVGQRALIQHADKNGDVRYFELRARASAVHFPIPDSVTELSPPGYRARLIPERSDIIMLDAAVLRFAPLP